MRPLLPLFVLAAAVAAGSACARSGPARRDPAPPVAVASAPEPDPGGGDAIAGRRVFAQQCAACHGNTGREGGVGPSLTGERGRKNPAQTAAWVENPSPPMPKLYPGVLSAKDVADVSAYVASL